MLWVSEVGCLVPHPHTVGTSATSAAGLSSPPPAPARRPLSTNCRRLALVASVAVRLLVGRGVDAQTVTPRTPVSIAAAGGIRGRLVDIGSAHAVATGSISVRRSGDTAFAGGALPRDDGTFRVDGLAPGRYTLHVRAMGYAPAARTDIDISVDHPVVDLGTLSLIPVAVTLQQQTVTAERADVMLAPDRNSYSTKNMATVSGGTAVDVLRNVPSVEVGASNTVSLRGNENVVVQINGRTSPLRGEQLGSFLAQLPAHAIARVEVATSPSAKNDPEGTAGIINLVLHQEAGTDLSGGFSASVASTRRTNLTGNLGRQSGRLTWFVSGNVSADRQPLMAISHRTNLVAPVPAFIDSRSAATVHPRSGTATVRSEYRLGPKDALSFDGFAVGGNSARSNVTDFTDLDATRIVIDSVQQFNDSRSGNLSQDYTLAFRHTGQPRRVTISSEVRFSKNDNRNDAEIFGLLHQADSGAGAAGTVALPHERDHSTAGSPTWDLQTDLTRPLGAGMKLETGFKGTSRHTSSDFTAAYLDTVNGVYVPAPTRSTDFDYREQIGAAYAVFSQQLSKLKAQAGLRLEEAGTRLGLPSQGEQLDGRYGSAFPSAVLSYDFTQVRQAKLSYSRRISRPTPFQLTPVEYLDDARHFFRGNPFLRPEYTDAYELVLQEGRGWGSVQLNPYLRRTAHAVRYIQRVDTSGAVVGTFDNVALATSLGSDLNLNLHRGPVVIFGGVSAYRYTSNASNVGPGLSARTTVWSARLNGTWKLSPRTDAQLFAFYRAPSATEGGSQSALVFSNVALQYKAWGDQGNISLRLTDPFGLMKFGYRTANSGIIESGERHFAQRALFLTVTRSFGQQLKLPPRKPEVEPAGPPQMGTP